MSIIDLKKIHDVCMFVCLFTVFFYIFFIKNLNMDQFWFQIVKNGPKQVLNAFFRGGFFMGRLPFSERNELY